MSCKSAAAVLAAPAFAQGKPAADKPEAKPTSSDRQILAEKVKADKKRVVAVDISLVQ